MDAQTSMRIMAGLLFCVGDFMLQPANTKPFKTYEEQLTLLKQRGMHISDDRKALEALKTENYYRISGYWLTMLKKNNDGTNVFYPGADFDNVMNLYQFDMELRKVIMVATITIETNLKAFVAYYHSQKYGPCGYMNSQNAEDIWKHATFINALSNDLHRRKEEPFVIHHNQDLGGIYPIWVATEVCSFDQISKFYRNMLPADRSNIAKNFYGISSREYIENWIHCAVVARNMAAHGARFYNKPNYKPAAMLPKNLKKYSTTMFGYVYAIYQLLPVEKKEDFLESITHVIENHSYAIIKHIGFPCNWKSLILQGAKTQEIPPYPDVIRADVERYLGNGWNWTVIAKMVNRVHGSNYSASEIRALHQGNSVSTE